MIDLEPLNRTPKSEVVAFPGLSEMPDGTILGNHALRLPAPHRVLLARRVRVLKHEDGQVYRDTETAFARRYIASLPSRIRTVRKEQLEGFMLSRQPSYCQPIQSDDEWLYIDLKAAYPSIYQRVPWRVEYCRNRYLGVTHDPPMKWPFPFEWKIGRSSVITMALPNRQVTYIDHGTPRIRPAVNPYRNAPLVALVWDVLAAIARVSIDWYGARYFNTDAAVVPSSKWRDYCDFLDEFGFDYSVKYRGPTTIETLGRYTIGDHSTNTRGTGTRALDAVPMTIDEALWLLLRFQRLTTVKSAA